jgi:hypothetical protein
VAPSDAAAVGAVAEDIKAGGSELHERLSVFWGTPSTLNGDRPGGRFPPLDRLDLLENGRLLAGVECRAGLTGPDRRELLVAGAGFALDFLGPGRATTDPSSARLGSLTPAGRKVIAEIREPQRLAGQDVRHLTKIVLFPVRFLFTAATGRVGTNHAAVEYYRTDPEAPAHTLVGEALAWRTTAPDPGVAADLLDRELLPLYVEYIDDHVPRLRDVGAGDLAVEFVAWRVIVLNSNCNKVGCGKGSQQERWLRAELARHDNKCTLAYFHHSRFSSDKHHGNSPEVGAFWDALYDYGAELVLSGHAHSYERFAPQTPWGKADPSHGIRQIVVGTGGSSLYRLGSPRANSQVRNASTFGVLKLKLKSDGYDWNFIPVAGKSFKDSGKGSCHGRP